MVFGLIARAALLSVAAGGAIGAMLRYLLVQRLQESYGELSGFVEGGLAANVIGCFFMGILVSWMLFLQSRNQGGADWGRSALFLFFGTGLLGGFTTFSGFAFDCAMLFYQESYGVLVMYIVASVVLSIAAIYAGFWLMKQVLR